MNAPALVLLPYAWAVEFRNDLRALLLERARAEQYAVSSHGILVPLYDLRELDKPADTPE